MEDWQITHITKNLSMLIKLTNFNEAVKTELIDENIICSADVEKLDAVQGHNGVLEACRLYYHMLLTRQGAYKVLTKALMKSRQSGASTILIRVPPKLFSKPLTYLGIFRQMDGLQDLDIEVHGKAFKMREFFRTIQSEILERIFEETVSELEIYDTFISKQRTFVLASNTIPPNPPYYVQRFLSNRIKIDKSIFKADCPDVFVFKNSIPRYRLSQIAMPHLTATSTSQLNTITCRFIYLDEPEDWNELKKIARVPVHLINYEGDDGNYFLLEDSSTPSDILRKLGSREERVYVSEEEFVQQQLSEDCSSSSVSICDTPGMGKTFLLANIARLMADKCAGRLVVFIKLTSFVNKFCQGSPNTTFDPESSLKNVLSYICPFRQNPELLLQLVKAQILQLEIFFDGFDEIPTHMVEWTKQSFRSLVTNFRNVKIYITSRPHMRQELEESLGVVSYDILPFNMQNQVDFLIQFWQRSKPNSGQLSLQIYALSCLEAVNKSLTKNEKEIGGIPILCQLIAEVYSDEGAFYSIKRRKIFEVPLKISGMYQKFIEKRINHVAKGNKEHDDIKMVHVWYALKLLYPSNNFHENSRFNNVKDLLTFPKILSVGILQKHSNSALEFIHRTLAEYFASDYFSTRLKDDKSTNSKEVNENVLLILKWLLKTQTNKRRYVFEYPGIVLFFDSALGEKNISKEQKIHAINYVSSALNEELISILCACCQHNTINIFSLIGEGLKGCDNFRIAECFTDQNGYKLLEACIRESSSPMFHKCIQLLTEELELDLAQIVIYNQNSTLLQMAVVCANYEAVEYFTGRISLKDQSILERCVAYNDEIETRENILVLMLKKDPTLIYEIPDILVRRKMDVRLFKILVKFGANLTTQRDSYNCAMHAATYMSPSDFHELVQFLLTDCKAEYLFVENGNRKDPLPTIISRAILLPETLDLLLNVPGIDINTKDKNGENLLFVTTKGNKLINFQQLVDRGLDYNARGKRNRSLLHAAAGDGEVEMVRNLLSLGLDPNSRDEDEWTPLHYAAYYNNDTDFSVVKLLVENGANVRSKTYKDETPLHKCASRSTYASVQVIEYLFGKGAGVNDRDKYGNTPIHLCKNKKVRDCLIEMGADIHAKNKKGQTPSQMYPDLWKSKSVTQVEMDFDF